MKSLLNLLQEESVAIYAVENHKNCSNDFALMASQNSKLREEMLKISKAYAELAQKKEKELLSIRLEIGKYISMIQNLEKGDHVE